MKRKQKACSRWKNRIFGVLLLSCCFVSLLVVQVQYSRIRPFTSFQKPKIAFLFIARNRLPVDLIWDAFFQGAKEPAFSIYIHSRPGFVFNKVTTRCPLFYGCQLNDSIQVDWGESSMIEAERILLRNALKDSLNERFVFLSDSFADTKEGRYNPKMDPLIPVVSWRKGSQWAVLTRKHAKVVAEDDTVISVFHQHCKLKGLEAELTRRPLTHTVWDMSSKDHERRGWHPVTYKHSDATPQLIHDIKSIDNIHYETEYRKEWCTNKGMSAPCFLFARKFTRNAAIHLLTHMKYAGEHDDDAESEMRSL
ncbi:hypothetical protein AMTRI_Chr03g141130 [Amborella trichopoda]